MEELGLDGFARDSNGVGRVLYLNVSLRLNIEDSRNHLGNLRHQLLQKYPPLFPKTNA